MDDEDPLLPWKTQLPFSEIEAALSAVDTNSTAAAASCSSSVSPPRRCPSRKYSLHRSKTAPSISVLHPLLSSGPHSRPTPAKLRRSGSVLKYAALLLLAYLFFGVLVYSTNPEGYSGIETHPAVDALYFCIVTLCTIGYGDIHPLTPLTKAISCVFVLVGFGILDVLLSAAVSYLLDLQETFILAAASAPRAATAYVVDFEKGRMRIRMKVGIAVVVVVLCVGAGTVALFRLEGLDWMEAFYLAVMSVTTVGYGDRAFNTLKGRVFASFWLLVSTLAVARAFLYLVEARIARRHRRIAKLVLQRELTVEDLMAADINHNGFISKTFQERNIQYLFGTETIIIHQKKTMRFYVVRQKAFSTGRCAMIPLREAKYESHVLTEYCSSLMSYRDPELLKCPLGLTASSQRPTAAKLMTEAHALCP